MRRRSRLLAGATALALALSAAQAEQTQKQRNRPEDTAPLSTSAQLGFELNIGRMIFLRVGAGGALAGGPSGAGPAASASVSSIAFNVVPAQIPGAAAPAHEGNSQAGAWTGAAPSFSASGTVTLPVEVRSNAGQVRLTVQTDQPLSNGSHQMPMSQIGIASDNADLPAPTIPNAGTSASVAVNPGGPGTAAAPTLLTQRSANWTFRYTPSLSPMAGEYTGKLTFTATAP